MDTKSNEGQSFYENSFQHLQDELKKIDLLIRWQVRRLRQSRNKAFPEEYAGLFISEEEIDCLLKHNVQPQKTDKPSPSPSSDHEELNKHLSQLNQLTSQKAAASLKKGKYLSLFHLSHLFGLSPFEVYCLLICLAVELDWRYERLFAYLQNDVTKKRPTVGLILQLLTYSMEERFSLWPQFSSRATLFKYNLLRFSDQASEKQAPLISRSLKLDDRIVEFLLEFNPVDSRIESFVRLLKPQMELEDVIIPGELKEKVNRLSLELKGATGQGKAYFSFPHCILYLKGSYGGGQQQTAEAVCSRLDLRLLQVDLGALPVGLMPFDQCLRLILREALLQSSGVYLKGFDHYAEEVEKNGKRDEVILRTLEEYPGLVFLEGEKSWEPKLGNSQLNFFTLNYPLPTYTLRRKLWSSLLDGYPQKEQLDTVALANKFRLTRGQIKDAIQTAKNTIFLRGADNSGMTMEDIYEACRAVSNQKLVSLSKKIKARYTWNDIVLPEEKFNQLVEICNYVRYRHVVYGDWGFGKKLSLGKGLNALFFGPSGTGKTMAAEVIASDLGLDLYKIDLSTVVSKYVGETEKNLSKIFTEAETSNSILFFDEADALFGKRSEVKDAHDRYANIEVGYLLQKMEEYEGIVVLATNMMRNMDDAFVRRMHFTVEFPFPDEEHRLKIWKTLLPEEVPRTEGLDFPFLAKKFKIAGGNIKNILVAAAFLAAQNSKRLDMKHLILASKREFQKMGKLCIPSDFGKYYDLTIES
jgi:AAA+ superfamily predicted ATPase